jgi:hypothetical protein
MRYRTLRRAMLVAAVAGAVLSVAWAGRETRMVTALHHKRPSAQEVGLRHEAESRVGREVHSAEGSTADTDPVQVLRAPPIGSDSTSGQDIRVWAMNDAELQNLYLAAERASLAGRYAALWEELGLSTAQAEKLADLIMWRDEQRLDITAIVRTKGLTPQDSTVARLRARTDHAFHASVAGLLGEEAYQEIARYERALPVWQFVNQFAGAVALEGQPLTGAQAARLTATLADASPPYRAGGEADPNTIEWTGVLTESAAILTEPQQISFRNSVPQYPVELGR